MAEVFTALTGSVILGTTHHGEVRNIRVSIPDIQAIEEVRTFGNQSYIKRTRPESVIEGTIDFVFQEDSMMYAFGSPTPNDVLVPISPIDYTWANNVTGSKFRIRFASAYITSNDFTQDRDGSLEGTITFQCPKSDITYAYSAVLP